MTVEAGLTGDRDPAFRAFVGDPSVSHHPKAARMFGEMFEAHGHLMPQF